MEQSKNRRKRGVVLTSTGLKRLQEAILTVETTHNSGERFSLEQLSDRINISPKTLSRLWSLSASVDQKTLKLCFSAFNLELQNSDYINGSEPEKVRVSSIVTTRSEDLELQEIPSFYPNLEDSKQDNSDHRYQCLCSYPDGPVPPDSPFYIERPPVEKLGYQEITQPGCLIRIRAPREMGKSSLVLRLLDFAKQQQYERVKIDCYQIDTHSLNDLDKFLRCFCMGVAQQLNIDPNIDANWDEEIGSKLSCTFYFKSYLLRQLKNPLVLVLEQVDRFFEFPQIAQEFFPLLRSWYEETRRDPDWQKLRLVVVYSTEMYVTLDLNRSPFNIGLPLQLPEFSRQQVQELARLHGLDWYTDDSSSQLMSLVGGHPSLIRIALYYLCCQEMLLEDLIEEAVANGGVYRYHLWRHWTKLQENPSLTKVFSKVVAAKHSIILDPLEAYKLESIGLIKYEGTRVKPSCELYRTYFKKQLSLFD